MRGRIDLLFDLNGAIRSFGSLQAFDPRLTKRFGVNLQMIQFSQSSTKDVAVEPHGFDPGFLVDIEPLQYWWRRPVLDTSVPWNI
jgi:hypothetical protein